jgi:hypothetical protein
MDARDWAARWVEADDDPEVPDRMMWTALQRVHGLDLVWTDVEQITVRHGGSLAFAHSTGDIRQALAAWQDDCRSYDAGGVGYVQRKKEAARAAALRDR